MNLLNKITNTKTTVTRVGMLFLAVIIIAFLLGAIDNQTKPVVDSNNVISDRLAFSQQLETLLRKDISASISVVAKDAGEVDATIQKSTAYPFLNGATVRFKNEGSPEVLVKNLLDAIAVQFPNNMALGKKLLSVDVRFRDKVYFGFEE